MGQEISRKYFSDTDFQLFKQRLHDETSILADWFKQGKFSSVETTAGFELEAWILDSNNQVAADNQNLINAIDSDLVVPELAAFNIEINGTPIIVNADGLNRLATELKNTWQQASDAANSLGYHLLMNGTLPSAKVTDMCVENMSDLKRYQALNDQVLRLRKGQPLEIDVRGSQDHLSFLHQDVMMESATTSFQIHIQVEAEKAHRYYNASKILSAPLVAMSANSPWLFGQQLWEETRIPIFEQAVSVGQSPKTQRVTFGFRYAEESIMDCFQTNCDNYPVLLPLLFDTEPEELAHLRLHNGTIWRWNRPLIGVENPQKPHVRIEQRVVPAGPSVVDCVANLAVYIGAVSWLANEMIPAEELMPFNMAKKNFYQAAQCGLSASVTWLDGMPVKIDELLLEVIIPMARDGLMKLGVSEPEQWLKIVRERVESGQNGACWQRQWVKTNGKDMQALVAAYYQHQLSGEPVHEWSLQ